MLEKTRAIARYLLNSKEWFDKDTARMPLEILSESLIQAGYLKGVFRFKGELYRKGTLGIPQWGNIEQVTERTIAERLRPNLPDMSENLIGETSKIIAAFCYKTYLAGEIQLAALTLSIPSSSLVVTAKNMRDLGYIKQTKEGLWYLHNSIDPLLAKKT